MPNETESRSKARTTVGVWKRTIPLLDAVCEATCRSRQKQIHYWTIAEARKLGVQVEDAIAGEPT